MKTPLFFIAALAAFFALPVDFTTMISAMFVTGLAAIAVADYRRQHRMPRYALAPCAAGRSRENLRLAA
ncbi:MAG TPA: hypothetical protein VHE61_13960 [Opitutaceae bacterium]|nr:hypothetical protein [Opitutaceae bacterium]